MSMEKNHWSQKLEVWGGVECTINRLGDQFHDQLARAGHYDRPDDIDRFVALGVRAMRYPILWERHEPTPGHEIDWTWTENQLHRLHHAGLTVIAGLVHHGSGPAFTELLDPRFPELLAAYALKVAQRFPWITHYTPVNEPMTTARFSGLYGLWYPHHKNDRSFLRMLIHQLKGTVLAMQAIRTVNPDAKLVQTEDLGKTHSTSLLRYQASFENDRRWLTIDLLHGKVTRSHPLWSYLVSSGIEEKELDFFTDHPCEAGCIGWNYYVTSERFLDEKIEDHPDVVIGGNGTHTYVDIEAVQRSQHSGLAVLLEEAWYRFSSPMAITEAHIGCTREEQMRWVMDIWHVCEHLRSKGMEIRAITVWALLGAFDWNSLLTRNDHVYESGVFDVSDHTVRPTALARMVTALSREGAYAHPLLAQAGWWNRARTHLVREERIRSEQNCSQPLLVIADNHTGLDFALACRTRNVPYIVLSFAETNLWTHADWNEIILRHNPWAAVYAQQRVDGLSLQQCFHINVQAPGKLAAACNKHHLGIMTLFSIPFDESQAQSAVSPQLEQANAYSKILGASWVSLNNPGAVITWSCVAQPGTPSEAFVPVHAALNLLIDNIPGTWNIARSGVANRAQPDGPARDGIHENRDTMKAALNKMKLRALRTPADPYSRKQENTSIIYQYFHHFISGTLN